jgi:nicotinamide mononucleotide (NMN) deamidase PncC
MSLSRSCVDDGLVRQAQALVDELRRRQLTVRHGGILHRRAHCALERSPANLAVAVTGVLGPDADEDGNPPGLVWFAVTRTGHDPRVIEEHFNHGDPDDVRRAAILRGLTLLGESASS